MTALLSMSPLKILLEHKPIFPVAPSASHLVACSRSLSMRIYALEQLHDSNRLNAILMRSLKPHSTPVVSAVIDHTGTLLATGSADGVVKVWDVREGYVTHTFKGHSGVISALKFYEAQPNGNTIEKSEKYGQNAQGQKSKRNRQSMENGLKDNAGTTASFRLATAGEDGKIRIWDLLKRKAIATLDSHVSVVSCLDYSPCLDAIVSASRDKTAIIWDARNWEIKRTIAILEAVESTGFLEDGKYFYTGGEHGRLRVWQVETGREITKEQEAGNEADGMLQILYRPSLDLILCIHVDQSLVIHSTSHLSGTVFDEIIDPLPISRRISGTHDEIIDLAFLSPTRSILALATNSESIRIVSVASQDGKAEPPTDSLYFGADVGLLQGHDEIVICLDVDWSGCWLATGAKDNTARLWRIDHSTSSFECFAIFTGHAETIGAISLPNNAPPIDSAAYKDPLSHPPQFLFTGSQDKTIKKWDIVPKSSGASGKKGPRAIYTRRAHEKEINAIAINHNSTLFASASQDRTVKIWASDEGEAQGVLRGHKRGVWSAKFAPKDITSISSDTGSTGSSRGFILTGGGDKTVRIWSLTDYSCIRTLEGHTNSVLKVLWLPSQPSDPTNPGSVKARTLLASAGGDGLVKVWDASTDECACTLDNHTDRVWALATRASTGHLVSGGGDGVVTFWADTTATTIAASAAASTARIEQEQVLLNHEKKGHYREAIVLALQLNHPARLLKIFSDVIKTHPPEPGSLSGIKAVDEAVTSLTDDQLYTLLLRLRDWNTNARTAPVAQRILWVIVKSFPAHKLVGLRKRGRGLKEVLEGLRVYTERHYKRLEELIDESYLVDFMVRGMEEGGFVADGGEVGNDALGLEDKDADVIMLQ